MSRSFLWSLLAEVARPADEKRRLEPALATASHGRLATSEGRTVEAMPGATGFSGSLGGRPRGRPPMLVKRSIARHW